jgi:hypothetical protein
VSEIECSGGFTEINAAEIRIAYAKWRKASIQNDAIISDCNYSNLNSRIRLKLY